MPNGQAHYIVFANEKGGTGKSTTAVHVAVALATQGHKVGVIDLDPRQRTVTRYLENREETSRRRGVTLPKIGRASCRERVCQYVSISVVADSLKKKKRGEKT